MVGRIGILGCVALGVLVRCKWTTMPEPSPVQRSCIGVAAGAVGNGMVLMNFAGVSAAHFFAAPFPARGRSSGRTNDDPTGSDGSQFPATLPLAFRLRDLVSTNGYAVSAGIFFELTEAVADPASLPDFEVATLSDSGTIQPGVLLFPLDDPAHPAAIRVGMTQVPDGVAQEPGHVLLNVLPMQGRPLRENTEYVAIVTTSASNRDEGGTMAALCTAADADAATGVLPVAGLGNADDVAEYVKAIQAVQPVLPCGHIAAMSVFTTGDPTATMRAAVQLAHADYEYSQGVCGVSMTRDTDASGDSRCPDAPYCVFVGRVNLPQYQRGSPPYLPYVQWGGGWPSSSVPAPGSAEPHCDNSVLDAGAPSDLSSWTPTWRTARVVVTIPRAPPPPSGYPTVVLVRAGAGSTTDPLVDRGPRLYPACDTPTACRGPAEVLQNVGFAGITIDGPLVGESRLEPASGDNEDFSIYNFLNPIALRDNLRQSALELTLVPDVLPQIDLPLAQCEGAGTGDARASFDLAHLALFSHSMGSSISPLALANDPRYRAAIMSGSGGSLIENVVHKAAPVPVYVAGELLNLPDTCQVDEFSPALSLLQWATEPSDSQVYARRMVADLAPGGASWWSPNARNVLMIQGFVDHDILPPIADVMSLAEGLDLGLGPNSCFGNSRCDMLPVYGEVATPSYPSIADLLQLSGRHYGALSLLTGNVPWPASVVRPPGVTGQLTALVVQHRIDENREVAGAPCVDVDGHEAIYESTLARHQYACFLSDFAGDETPVVRAAGGEFTACTP